VNHEPVKNLLGNINKTLIRRLVERKYGSDVSAVPAIDYLAVEPKAVATLPASVVHAESASGVTHQFNKTHPKFSAWLEMLGGDKLSWLRVLVTSNIIVQGTSYID
jgi:fatty acid synthase subunit beta